MTAALFIRQNNTFVPTELSGSPWSPDHLHGGPVTGLLAHVCESVSDNVNTRLSRLTVDLLRPVPKAPLTVMVDVVRSGRRMRLLGATILADGTRVCQASALFLERRETEVPSYARFPTGSLPPPLDRPTGIFAEISGWMGKGTLPGLHTTVEACLLDGADGRGSGRAWMRLPVPLVAGEPVSPVVRAATLADFGNGVGQLRLDPSTGCINADVTLYLHREPDGEWLGLDASSRMQSSGSGLVETDLFDAEGPIGRITQATLTMPVYAGND